MKKTKINERYIGYLKKGTSVEKMVDEIIEAMAYDYGTIHIYESDTSLIDEMVTDYE